MIPHRIKLSGFLSYKGEQDIRFDGAPVWMLAGTNGSGKSSIFDAVTYSLFGHHRGGSQNAAELINKESTGLAVEFDFHLEGKLFRIKRTLRRSLKGAQSSTQQVFIHQADGEWAAVPDTTKKVDFDRWVSDKIGLTYDIFTSSVLLLQGKAEKLLDSKPSGRFEVLAGIVDLERYQRLHEKANTKKNELKSKLDTVSAQAEGVPDVTDEQFATVIIAIDTAEQARDAARTRVDETQERVVQAGRWADAEGRAAAARGKLQSAESLMSDAVRIEKDHARLTELKAVLPTVQTVVTVRNELKNSDDRRANYDKRRVEETERKSKAESWKGKLQRQREQDVRRLREDEDMLAENVKLLRELEGQLQTVRLVDDESAKMDRLKNEAKSLPADPEAELTAARDEEAKVLDMSRVLPILERVNTERHDLGQVVRLEAESKKLRDKTAQDGKEAKTTADAVKKDLDDSRKARTQAEADSAVAKAEVERATAAVAEFATLSGAKSCRACGQPLTAAHFKEEKAKREDELKQAEAKLKRASTAAKDAAERERKLTDQEVEQSKKLTDLRELYKDHESAYKQAGADIDRLTKSLNLRYAELKGVAHKISPALPSDWIATKYPERDELVTLRREVDTLDAVRRKVKSAEADLKKWNDIRSRAAAAEENLKRLRGQLTDDPGTIRTRHAGLQSQEKTLTTTVKEARLALETLDREIDKAGREAHAAVTALAGIAKQLESEDEKQKIHTDNLKRALAQLSPEWRKSAEEAGLKENGLWKSEFDELTAKGTEAKFRQLEQARIGLGAMRDDIAKLEAEAAVFPPDVRKAADEVKAQVLMAKQEFDTREKELRDAEKHRDKLDGFRQQRAKLSDQYKQIDREHTRHKVLSELLGRDRLQRHLVRQAERQIVDYGNAVLDRLSGGQLFLKLVGTDDGDGNKALDLECFNRHTGGAPINVAFLSGSQKFRVAVSLALAIGQYASRQHRPIESVIIDEGFGCLDRQGRQVMIQELQNLRGHLHCILLVSHQEEFADAFADGYRFELQDGATKVSRFQR